MTEKIVGPIKLSYTGPIDLFRSISRVADRPHGPNGFLGDGGRGQHSVESHFLERNQDSA